MTKERRQCSAKRTNGETCHRRPINGGSVCYVHGGAAPQVKRKAAERLADLIDPDRLLREAARLAYSDIREVYDERGRLKPIQEWPDDLAAAVGGVEVVKRNVDSGDGHQDDVIKLKLWDKPKNVELLFRHLGMLRDRLDVRMPEMEAVLAKLEGARRRATDLNGDRRK